MKPVRKLYATYTQGQIVPTKQPQKCQLLVSGPDPEKALRRYINRNTKNLS